MESLFGFLATAADQKTDRRADRQTDRHSLTGRRTDKRPFHAANETNLKWPLEPNRAFDLTLAETSDQAVSLSLSLLLSSSLSLLSFRKRCVLHTHTHTHRIWLYNETVSV